LLSLPSPLKNSVGLTFFTEFLAVMAKAAGCYQKFLMLKFGGRRYEVRVVFMGSPDFAVTPLEYLIINQYQVVAVYTQPDRQAGRGRSLASPPVKRSALAHGLPVVQPARLRSPESVAQLAELHPDVIVVAAYGQLLPHSVLDIPVHGCINIHPSLLPKYRGVSPVAAAILAGDRFTGVSVMLMDQGMDTGPVLARAQVPVSARDTTGSLGEKLSLIGAHLLLDVLARWARGEITPQPQDEAGATYCGAISREAGEIDWHLSAVELWRQVRAYQPWPGCYTRWQGKQLKIIEAVPLDVARPHEAGRVVALDGKEAAFGVATGDGVLGVLRVQLEGKRAMSAADFLRGQRQLIGAILPST
jgi:methionyl-tRNA formyltransferase